MMRRWRSGLCRRRSCCSCRESCQCVRDGRCVRSTYQRECCRCCGCGCDCQDSSSSVQTVCYCSRFIDVPMSVYYGPGYTELDCCMTQSGILQDISDALSACCPPQNSSCC